MKAAIKIKGKEICGKITTYNHILLLICRPLFSTIIIHLSDLIKLSNK